MGSSRYNLPPIYAPRAQALPVCFDELHVQRTVRKVFRSADEAELLKSLAHTMCQLAPIVPLEPQPSLIVSLHVMFLERAWNRFVLNAPELCAAVDAQPGVSAVLVVESIVEQYGTCAAVELMARHEVFVTREGSHETVLAFARRGSVVITAYTELGFGGMIKSMITYALYYTAYFGNCERLAFNLCTIAAAGMLLCMCLSS